MRQTGRRHVVPIAAVHAVGVGGGRPAGPKAIAREPNIPVVALSRPSRQAENRDDKRPQLSDLRESGSIEQDTNVVMFACRDEHDREREKPCDYGPDKADA